MIIEVLNFQQAPLAIKRCFTSIYPLIIKTAFISGPYICSEWDFVSIFYYSYNNLTREIRDKSLQKPRHGFVKLLPLPEGRLISSFLIYLDVNLQ